MARSLLAVAMLHAIAPLGLGAMPVQGALAAQHAPPVDVQWYPPRNTSVNSLPQAINGTGTYGFIFNTSQTPADVPYGTYNWCNMPHVRHQEYPLAPADYQLKYVEVIHRHHKRTPYAHNCFPVETEPWSCADSGLFYFGEALDAHANRSAATYWKLFADAQNPFNADVGGCRGDCEFPQITHGGLDDAWQHGRDLYDVYHGLLGLIPDGHSEKLPDAVSFRVTNNVITSQVAGMVLNGMFNLTRGSPTPLLIQEPTIDSLEPTYPCSAADAMKGKYGVNSTDPTWQAHLNASTVLFQDLDKISGVDSSTAEWHVNWDHYFDNLSARLCHAKPLPCNKTTSQCVTSAQANEVFRLGEWEYSWLYRGASQSLNASSASFGVWVVELAAHLRAVQSGQDHTVYRHNVAHDGSISALLSIFQLDKMVWPGMGSELVFELYEKSQQWFLRVLWGGKVFTSSSPTLGKMNMVPLDKVLGYFDGLVGQNAQLVPGKCTE